MIVKGNQPGLLQPVTSVLTDHRGPQVQAVNVRVIRQTKPEALMFWRLLSTKANLRHIAVGGTHQSV